MAYSDLVPIGSALIIALASFGLGVVYGNVPYDYYTLWAFDPDGFNRSKTHYALWATVPMRVHYLLHAVAALGLVGCFIKLYKPHPDVKLFEYGSLVLLMVAVVIYLTNLRIGINSALTGEWGDVDQNTGINVIAASLFMVVIALTGVLFLQAGLYYAKWYERKIQLEFLAKEKSTEVPTETEPKSEATASGAAKPKAKRRT